MQASNNTSAQVKGTCLPAITRQQRRAIARRDRKRLGRLAPHQCGYGEVAEMGLLEPTLAFAKAMIETHGRPPHDISVVSGHEAGHLIAALSFGGEFKDCYVQVQPGEAGAWVGYTEVFVPGVHGPFNIQLEPERAVKYAAQVAGGLAAEWVMERAHPASSPEEVMLLEGIAAVLELEHGAIHLISGAATIINENLAAFDLARELLERNHRITNKDIPAIRELMAAQQNQGGEV